MLMPKPPKKFLVDSFEYKEYLGEGDWNKPVYNGLIFCYHGLTMPFPEFKEQSLVIYDGKEHVITKIDTVIEAYQAATIYSYEIEVV